MATSSRRSPRELRASPTVSPALSRRKGGAGKRRHRAARAGRRACGCSGARRAAAPHRGRAGCLRSALAFARWSRSSRRPLGGRGSARTRPSPGGGVAPSALAALARPGDIDSVAIAPTGIAATVETKTRTYDGRHLARVREQAAWLSRRRRRWARNGALGVMCVVRVRRVERVEHDVLVVSMDRLTHVLRVAAGMDTDANSQTRAGRQPSRLMSSRSGRANPTVAPWRRQRETVGAEIAASARLERLIPSPRRLAKAKAGRRSLARYDCGRGASINRSGPRWCWQRRSGSRGSFVQCHVNGTRQ